MTPPKAGSPKADAIVAEHLVKQFGATKALDDISVSIAPGELFGFIGPDGAGKRPASPISSSA